MLEEGVDHVPVLDDGRLVGICTRTDVLSARRPQLALDRREPGWLAERRGIRAAARS
jgi:CBS domain-containing protein